MNVLNDIDLLIHFKYTLGTYIVKKKPSYLYFTYIVKIFQTPTTIMSKNVSMNDSPSKYIGSI